MATGSIFVLGSFVVACSAKVARFPRPGESLRAEIVTVEPGGKGFNLALGARRLGCPVDGLLAIGDDLLSSFAAPALEAADLPATLLVRFTGQTGSGIGFTDDSGENCLAVDPGANLRLSASDVRARAAGIAGASLVLAQFEIGDAPILEAFSLARSSGVRTMLNPSPYRPISAALLAHTSILIVNATEAAALAADLGLDPPYADNGAPPTPPPHRRLAEALFARGPDTVIVTLGAAGAWAFRSSAPPLFQPPFAIDSLDSLGAGDAFGAGLAASLARGESFEAALQRAAGCGAMATRGPGVFSMLPTSLELAAFLETCAI